MRSHLSHLGIAIAVLVFALTLYGVAYAVVAQKSADVAQLESDIAAQTEIAGRIAAARSALSELDASEAQVQAYFVPETGVVNFISDMQARGESMGAEVGVSSVQSVEGEDRPALSFALTVAGPFDAVMRTVGAIEHAPYALSLTGFSLSKVEGVWKATVDIRVGSVKAESASVPSRENA